MNQGDTNIQSMTSTMGTILGTRGLDISLGMCLVSPGLSPVVFPANKPNCLQSVSYMPDSMLGKLSLCIVLQCPSRERITSSTLQRGSRLRLSSEGVELRFDVNSSSLLMVTLLHAWVDCKFLEGRALSCLPLDPVTAQMALSLAIKGWSEDLCIRRSEFESHLCPLPTVWLWLWFSHLLNGVNNLYLAKLP